MAEDPIVPLMHVLVESIEAAAARWNETIPEDWDSFGLVLGLQDGRYAQGYGYAYGPGDAWMKAISVVPETIESALEAFLADRYSEGQTLPVKILFQLRLTDGRYDAVFEDSNRSRWKVSPANFRETQAELQHAFD